MRKQQNNHIFQLYSYFRKNEERVLSGKTILTISPICLKILKNCHSYGSQEEKFILHFLSKIQVLKIEPTDKHRIESRGEYELSCFDSLIELQIINCKPTIITNINDYRKQLQRVSITGCLNSLEELLDFQMISNKEVWFIAVLNCSRNNIPEIDSSAMLLERVEEIDFSHNLISEIKNLEKSLYLKSLNLSFNRVENLMNVHMNLKNIRILNLKNNYITFTTGLSKLFLLEYLDLSCNIIASFKEIEKISNLRNLNWLWLDGNPVADLDQYRPLVLKSFAREIILDGKNLSDFERNFISELQSQYIKPSMIDDDDPSNHLSPSHFAKKKKKMIYFDNDDQELSPLEVAETLPDFNIHLFNSDTEKYKKSMEEMRERHGKEWLIVMKEAEPISLSPPRPRRKRQTKKQINNETAIDLPPPSPLSPSPPLPLSSSSSSFQNNTFISSPSSIPSPTPSSILSSAVSSSVSVSSLSSNNNINFNSTPTNSFNNNNNNNNIFTNKDQANNNNDQDNNQLNRGNSFSNINNINNNNNNNNNSEGGRGMMRGSGESAPKFTIGRSRSFQVGGGSNGSHSNPDLLDPSSLSPSDANGSTPTFTSPSHSPYFALPLSPISSIDRSSSSSSLSQPNANEDERKVKKRLADNEFLVEKSGGYGEVTSQRLLSVLANCIKEFDINDNITLQINDKELLDTFIPPSYGAKTYRAKISYKIALDIDHVEYMFASEEELERFILLTKSLEQYKKLFCMSCKAIFSGIIGKSKCPKCQSSYLTPLNSDSSSSSLRA